jgi:hypothetical protein
MVPVFGRVLKNMPDSFFIVFVFFWDLRTYAVLDMWKKDPCQFSLGLLLTKFLPAVFKGSSHKTILKKKKKFKKVLFKIAKLMKIVLCFSYVVFFSNLWSRVELSITEHLRMEGYNSVVIIPFLVELKKNL